MFFFVTSNHKCSKKEPPGSSIKVAEFETSPPSLTFLTTTSFGLLVRVLTSTSCGELVQVTEDVCMLTDRRQIHQAIADNKYLGQTGCVLTYLLPDTLYRSSLQLTTHAMKKFPNVLRKMRGVVVVDGLKTIPYYQHCYSTGYAVSSLEVVYNGARDELRDIEDGLEEDLIEVAMTEAVKTKVLPARKMDKFCEEMSSVGNMSEAAVMVEGSESVIYGSANILTIMSSPDLVTRGQEGDVCGARDSHQVD